MKFSFVLPKETTKQTLKELLEEEWLIHVKSDIFYEQEKMS